MTLAISRRITLAVLLSACGLVGWAGFLSARGDGISGRAQSTTGCSCHSSTPNANGAVTTTISGPQSVAPSSTHSYTISVTGGPSGTTGGFDLMASGGTLVAGVGTRLLSGDLVHADNTRRSWTFDWTAPAVDGTVNMYAVGQPTNGSGSSSDSWNWYGGAVNSAFQVTVSSLVAVGDEPTPVLWLGPATPSPTVSGTTVHFGLREAGPVELSVFDVRGSRVASLARGEYPSGAHAATWNGRRDDGSVVGAGWYVIRLEVAGVVKSTRVLRLGS